MNNRNELDSRNEVNFWEYLLPLFFLAVVAVIVAVIVGGVVTVQCGKPKEQPKQNLRVPYNPLYTKPEIADSTKHDWVKDENVCIERRLVYEQMLNEKLAR